MKKHKLIVLEGLDRSGKTTVSSILAERLQPCSVIRFPNRTNETGRLLDSFLTGHITLAPETAHLLYSANRYEEAENINQLLENGHVICDRYWLSGAVYSAAKGLDFEWCKGTDLLLPKADVTFFIDVSVDTTSKRMEFGNEVHDNIAFQKRVYGIYKCRTATEGVIIVDGEQTIEKITEEIMMYLDRFDNENS